MKNIKVKICGIKTKSAALVSAKCGADFLGFNFVPGSKRKITPNQASKITSSLASFRGSASDRGISNSKNERRDHSATLRMTPLMVGVFMNQSQADIKKVLLITKLNMLQFHGDETPKFCQSFGLPYIKAFGIGEKTVVSVISKQMRKYKAKYFLLDRPKQGRGESINLKKVSRFAAKFPIMLAGGLTPENVRAITSKAGKIKAVDVAGGVETKGEKDSKKILSLTQIVHPAIV